MASKFYAVRKGKTPGVYETWDECKNQVDGVSGAEYKSFKSRSEAEAYILDDKVNENTEIVSKVMIDEGINDRDLVAYVDGSYSKELKRYSYGCVLLYDRNIIELSGSGNDEEYITMNNVAGEILGSINAINWAVEHGFKSMKIYYDYEGIEKWAEGIWKTNKFATKEYKKFFDQKKEIIDIIFVKVLAHSGIEYNEKADRLAKNALLLEVTNSDNVSEIDSYNFEMFKKIMTEVKDEKEKGYFKLGNYLLSETRIIKLIKSVWSHKGYKKNDILKIEFTFDFYNMSLQWNIYNKEGKCFNDIVKINSK